MAFLCVENGKAVSYHGITIYHLYEGNRVDQEAKEYRFTLNPLGMDEDSDSFDIREKKGYLPQVSPAANLVRMIDDGIFGETNLAEREAMNRDDTYEGEEYSESHCPVCGAELTDYEAFEVHDDQIEYPFTCSNCGVSGSEWANLVFNCYTVD